MQNIAANNIGESIVWYYVRDNWEKMVDRFGLNERYLGRMIPSICGRFSTKTKLDEVSVCIYLFIGFLHNVHSNVCFVSLEYSLICCCIPQQLTKSFVSIIDSRSNSLFYLCCITISILKMWRLFFFNLLTNIENVCREICRRFHIILLHRYYRMGIL